MLFTYRSKGSADDWSTETVEAETVEDAQNKLDQIYGITRDKDGVQTNMHAVQVEILS